jgi:hypothetical protein
MDRPRHRPRWGLRHARAMATELLEHSLATLQRKKLIMNTNLTTIDLATLHTVTGGDFATRYRQTLKQDVKDIGSRWNRAQTAARNGDVRGAFRQGVATSLDVTNLVGDAVAPVYAVTGGPRP